MMRSGKKYIPYILWFCWLHPVSLPCLSQVQTARHVVINSNCHGYYEYLPQGYQPGGPLFPLLVFIHGLSQLGNGNSQLSAVLWAGPPLLINQGQFPDSFTVGNQSFKFIVISPQFIAWPAPGDVDSVISYALSSYQADPTRVYLSGMSMGGGAVWDYASDTATNFVSRLAAIVPVCGASYPDTAKARVMASANLPVWATHNQNDPTVPSLATTEYVNWMNLAPAPSPKAMMTLFPSNQHDAWTQTYDPGFTQNGLNIYQWMLQYSARNPSGTLPVILGTYRADLTAADHVLLKWNTSAEDNCQYYSIARRGDSGVFRELARVPASNLSTGSSYSYMDESPQEGTNFYRLSQTDLDGKKVYLGIREMVVSNSVNHNQSLVVYPNPARNFVILHLNLPESGPYLARIVGTDGSVKKTIYFTKQSRTCDETISLQSLSAGIYFLEISGKQSKYTETLFKQ